MPPIPPVPPVPPPVYWRRKEPIGAIVLIGLGIMFLLGQLDIFNGRFWDYMWPLFLIGLGLWLMLNRVGPRAWRSEMNRYILIRRLRGPAFLLLVGVIALLNQTDILSWGHAWPLFLILAGALLLAERAALAGEDYSPYPHPCGGVIPPDPQPQPGTVANPGASAANPGTQIVRSDADDFINRGGQS